MTARSLVMTSGRIVILRIRLCGRLDVTLREDRRSLGDAVVMAQEFEVALQLTNILCAEVTIAPQIWARLFASIIVKANCLYCRMAKPTVEADPVGLASKRLISWHFRPESSIKLWQLHGR